MRADEHHLALLSAVLLVCLLGAAPAASQGPGIDESGEFASAHLGAKIIVLPGVFSPIEAEVRIMPFMKDHPELFRGKTVLEIGTGSGVISLYAAKLGAAKVVSTDISKQAVESAKQNAARLGFGSTIDVRLVPPSDISAYSVIAPSERFDVIISNPPFALELDAYRNTPLTDTGDLGLSIVRGLKDHMEPGGHTVLLYGTLFYHEVMVKYAKYLGYDVRNHIPPHMSPREARALFNSYVARLLEREGIEPDAIVFRLPEMRQIGRLLVSKRDEEPLVGDRPERRYPALMAIRNRSDQRASE